MREALDLKTLAALTTEIAAAYVAHYTVAERLARLGTRSRRRRYRLAREVSIDPR